MVKHQVIMLHVLLAFIINSMTDLIIVKQVMELVEQQMMQGATFKIQYINFKIVWSELINVTIKHFQFVTSNQSLVILNNLVLDLDVG